MRYAILDFYRKIADASRFLENQISQGIDTSEAMNRSGIEFVRCAKVFHLTV